MWIDIFCNFFLCKKRGLKKLLFFFGYIKYLYYFCFMIRIHFFYNDGSRTECFDINNLEKLLSIFLTEHNEDSLFPESEWKLNFINDDDEELPWFFILQLPHDLTNLINITNKTGIEIKNILTPSIRDLKLKTLK